MLTVFLLTVAIMALVFVGMAITMLVKKNGKFPNTHISGNKYLKQNGVYCSQTQDKIEQQKAWKNLKIGKVKLITEENDGH